MLNTTQHGIILAAGGGLVGGVPRPLLPACGAPVADLVARSLRSAGVEHPVAVLDQETGPQVREALGSSCQYAWSDNPNGSGRMVLAAEPQLREFRGPVAVLQAEAALITPEALRTLFSHHRETNAAVTIATIRMQDPTGHDRVVRDPHGKVCRIVPDEEANPRTRAIQEVSTGVGCFDSEVLFAMVPRLLAMNGDDRCDLCHLVELIYDGAGTIETRVFEDSQQFRSATDLWELAIVAKTLERRIQKRHCLAGVRIADPDSTYIGADVEIGSGAVIEPLTSLLGTTKVGPGCHIGPQSVVSQSVLEEGCTVFMSQVNGATVKKGARVGPFANLRPGAVIGEGAKVGNFVEVKNALLGPDASVSHLSYIGDGTVGANANIGAGVIFCNFDGFTKSRTEVGDRAFVGSNCTLIAPVSIGDGAVVAAGSTITNDVPADAGAFARARQETREGWAITWRKRKQPECN